LIFQEIFMNLIEFCIRLAVDPVLFARYLANPAAVAAELGLADELFLILLSGDRDLIAEELAAETGGLFVFVVPIVHVGTTIWPLL
jgi:hypothetical protein